MFYKKYEYHNLNSGFYVLKLINQNKLALIKVLKL
jgi:hypothetical protein